jgi:hypothetical protein
LPIPRLPQNDREFTYQAGWKKGVINAKASNEPPVVIAHKEGIEQYIWHKAHLLPASLDMYLLCALPLISIFAIAVLVYFINQF